MQFSPIVIFAFNRPDALQRLVESLHRNPECAKTDLFVFIDGARQNKTGESEKVMAVRKVAESVEGFAKVEVRCSETNKGLAKSIIGGTTEIINRYGKVIVLEDDLVVRPNFLAYMNQMLDKYADKPKVFQITGFGLKIRPPKDYAYDMYFHYRAHSWSWATWKDRWDTVDWEVKSFAELAASRELRKAFNRGGSDLFGMLRDYMEGRNNSWYIRFNYEMHRQRKLCVTPLHTLIHNDGFGMEATHCNGFNRYTVEPGDDTLRLFRCNPNIEPDERLSRQVVAYWSIPYRIYGKLRQKLHLY